MPGTIVLTDTICPSTCASSVYTWVSPKIYHLSTNIPPIIAIKSIIEAVIIFFLVNLLSASFKESFCAVSAFSFSPFIQ
ncbi:MAG: hypothetical protein M1584_01125, partial [Deltaproteobacteria bacterium]|nr:hypothetical protein [Deltaproteobacteria bacterium]